MPKNEWERTSIEFAKTNTIRKRHFQSHIILCKLLLIWLQMTLTINKASCIPYILGCVTVILKFSSTIAVWMMENSARNDKTTYENLWNISWWWTDSHGTALSNGRIDWIVVETALPSIFQICPKRLFSISKRSRRFLGKICYWNTNIKCSNAKWSFQWVYWTGRLKRVSVDFLFDLLPGTFKSTQ